MKNLFKIFLLLTLFAIVSFPQNKKIELGADRLIPEYSSLLKNRKIGLITNSTGTLSNGKPLYKELIDKGFTVSAIFAPEHGFGINFSAGINVKNSFDAKYLIPVFSLYGSVKKPTKEMLKNVDVFLFDIQDIGARFYTYISTLYYVLQSAAENNIKIFILDRPDPINGITVDGPVLKSDQASFVGIAPLPIQYGMTSGELALFFSNEGYLGKNLKPDIIIVKMKNWNRKKYFDQFPLRWIKPSPNIPDLETALIYPGTCLLEGTNVSEGRGTHKPFLTIGAPFINSQKLINELKDLKVSGISFSPVKFTPVLLKEMAESPKYSGQTCYGISFKITDRKKFMPVKFGIKLICALEKLYPDEFKMTDYFDKLTGDSSVRKNILNEISPEKIIGAWNNDLKAFNKIRKKYLLY